MSASVQPSSLSRAPQEWTPDSWRARAMHDGHPGRLAVAPYTDPDAVVRVERRLAAMPPLVTSWEIENLKGQLAEAQEGRRFLLWGGDCAETFADCTPEVITSKLKILLQMSLVLVYAGKRPVIRVGRVAGQYAKPRSSAAETRVGPDGSALSLPSYFGDIVNGAAFEPEARRPDPERMISAHQHAAMTLNFIRSLLDAGFADIHHPEYWDLGFLRQAGLHQELRQEYQRLTERVTDGLRFMDAMGSGPAHRLAQSVDLFTSHEALNLHYEAAHTRTVPRRSGHYNLSTHLPWLGWRTREPAGPHAEYLRGVRNPVGLKVGAEARIDELLRLIDALNPSNEPGRLVLIARLGAKNVRRVLPGLVEVVRRAGRRVLWVCDPMHGNTVGTSAGLKTRSFDDIRAELSEQWEVHRELGSALGGVHVELTGQDVTECLGGARGLREGDLAANYDTACDPRLNYEQSLELAFVLARLMQGGA